MNSAIASMMDALGPEMLSHGETIEAVIAACLLAVIIFGGWALNRAVGPKLAQLWDERAGPENKIAHRRIRNMLICLAVMLGGGIILAAWDWSILARILLGLAVSVAVGVFANNLLRGLRLPGWLAKTTGVLLFGALAFALIGGAEPLTQTLERIGFDIGKRRISLLLVLTYALTIVILFAIARLIMRVSNLVISNSRLDSAQKVLGQKLASVAIVVVATFVGLDFLSIDLTALTVFSGAFGLAIGFGMQKTVGNLIAGIILLMDRSIKPGDVIAVGDSFGWVNKIGVRAVSVLTREGKEHLIPNEDLMTREVENWSYSNKNVRISIPVGVSYNSDMDHVIASLHKACDDVPRALKNPKPVVWMTEFGDSSVNFEIRCWIRDPENGVGNFQASVLKRIWDVFKEEGIEIPFPQRDVHVKSLPAQSASLNPEHGD